MVLSDYIADIKPKFDEVLKYSQELNEVKTDEIFENWATNKIIQYKLLNNQLIYEWPEKITFHLDEAAKEKRFIDLLDDISDGDESLMPFYRFLSCQKESFFQNKVSNEWHYNDKKILVGDKLLKAFKYFIEDKKVLRYWQDRASHIIQEDKMTGTLCFSIHPLDYLSISENNSNWRSCHALDGDYRAGNLSYMMDPTTIVVYLRDDDTKSFLPRFPSSVPWNNKIWRVLWFINQYEIPKLGNYWYYSILSKQYPFATNDIFNYLKLYLNNNAIKNKINFYNYDDWSNTYIETLRLGKSENVSIGYRKYFLIDNIILNLNDIIYVPKYSAQYNDILASPTYERPYYLFPWGLNNNTKMQIGQDTYCIKCGKRHVYKDKGTMMCSQCFITYAPDEAFDDEDICYCECCGTRMWINDAGFVEDSEGVAHYYCDECLNKNTERCNGCGEPHYIKDMIYIQDKDYYLCEACYEGE